MTSCQICCIEAWCSQYKIRECCRKCHLTQYWMLLQLPLKNKVCMLFPWFEKTSYYNHNVIYWFQLRVNDKHIYNAYPTWQAQRCSITGHDFSWSFADKTGAIFEEDMNLFAGSEMIQQSCSISNWEHYTVHPSGIIMPRCSSLHISSCRQWQVFGPSLAPGVIKFTKPAGVETSYNY